VTRDERISTVRQLWSLTRDLLVLIEPGTPEGSSLVREMRTHILQMEKKVQPLAVPESSLVF
jgi:ribosomal protein RSM22 (predicted rRNA methylase)